MLVRIYDLSKDSPTSYVVASPEAARDATARRATKKALRTGRDVLMGAVIAEPFGPELTGPTLPANHPDR